MPIPRSGPEIHVDDYGTVLRFQVRNGRTNPVDLSSSESVTLLFMRPDGSNFSRAAILGEPFGDVLNDSFSGGSSGGDSSGGNAPGSSGFVHYVIQPGDLDVEGQWYLQIAVELGGGFWHSSVVAFTVYPNLFASGQLLQP